MSQKSQFKILIGIPCGSGYMDYRFTTSLIALQLIGNTTIIVVPRVMIDTARNSIVTKALDGNFTHLFMLDDDMIFPPETLVKLLGHDKDIVGVQAFKRREPFEPCVYIKKEGKYFPALINKFTEVDAIGTGVFLVKIDVFKKLKFPWFETLYDEEGTHWSVDFMICKKATSAGFQIFCDPTLEFFHIGDSPVIGKEDFLKYAKEKGLLSQLKKRE